MVTLVGLSAQGVRWAGRRGSIDKDASVVMEDDVVDLVGETDLSVGSDEIEIVQYDSNDDIAVSGRDSRRARRDKRKSEENGLLDTAGPGTIEPVLEIQMPDYPMAPPISGQVICPGCKSRFATEPGVMSMKCPVCGSKIDL
jgi:hypothetical protein